MIMDTQEQFAVAQSIAAAAGDVASTNYLDTGAAQDEGIGEYAQLVIRTVAAVTSGGAATVQFILQTDDNSSFSSAKEYPLTSAKALAALTANTEQYIGKLPNGLERYLRVVARIGTATTTAGTMDAFLVKDAQAYQFGLKGFTVS